jgi:hypothetical protein
MPTVQMMVLVVSRKHSWLCTSTGYWNSPHLPAYTRHLNGFADISSLMSWSSFVFSNWIALSHQGLQEEEEQTQQQQDPGPLRTWLLGFLHRRAGNHSMTVACVHLISGSVRLPILTLWEWM